ncbi:unnamed protein product [Microthlaspi erraticum]|uniref:DNA-directed RNA polymerase III subunit RPC5 n=1 Tax=Microthlaspi erraticum TaxID=1685480 RepID=A0A6D2KPC1_9BRAS|nr:unnamed protein product [Microthlaspi erraticum]CAA7058792.1 unnamed protein product [Microthlaspi erraticum]
MDFDDEDKPKEVAKTRRFAPGRAGKPKLKPKPEPTAAAKPEPPPSQTDDVDAKFSVSKVEPEVYNGAAVKMEIDPKVDKEPEPEMETPEVELMEVDQLPLPEQKEEEEEEDVVVREIDVYFNPSIDANTKLYVLQYPLRPSWRPYEMDERCEEVRVNPSTSQVEIDMSMDVNSSNYDSEFGSKLHMTKQTLTTTWKQPPTLDYAIGVLSGDKLHLNPVHAVAQLRPSMDYLSTKKKQEEAIEESAGTSKKKNKAAQASADQKPVDEEKWVSLKYHGLQSEFSSKYLMGMMANENSSIDFNMSPEVYINSLCRGESSRNSESKDISIRALTSLPLEERVQKLLCKSFLMGRSLFRYSVLKYYAPEYSDEDFLKVLEQYAWLVQGLWTPKTSLLKLGKLEFSRDYGLMQFSKGPTIKYSVVEATGARLKGDIKTRLSEFAKDRPLLCDWKFKEPTDVSFQKFYPEIADKQANIWKEMEVKLNLFVETQKAKSNRKNTGGGKNPPETEKPENPATQPDKGGASSRVAKSVGPKMSEDIRRAIPKALKKVFQTHKVCSYETICQTLRDYAVLQANNPKSDTGMAKKVAEAVDAHQDELKEIISEVTVNIHGSFVSKSSPDHPEFDALREVVISLLLVPGKKLMKAHVLEAGKTVLGRQIPNNEFLKVMHDFCEVYNSGWVLKKAR